MGLVSIGPVTISHGDPAFSGSSSPTGHGLRPRQISGSCSWAAFHTLDELVGNEDNKTTKGGHTGVEEWLVFDDALLAPFTGYYLLENFSFDVSQKDSLTVDDAPFTLSTTYVGDLA